MKIIYRNTAHLIELLDNSYCKTFHLIISCDEFMPFLQRGDRITVRTGGNGEHEKLKLVQLGKRLMIAMATDQESKMLLTGADGSDLGSYAEEESESLPVSVMAEITEIKRKALKP